VALVAAARNFGIEKAAMTVLRGAWIVVPYTLGGLIFWQMAFRPGRAGPPVEMPLQDARARRRLLFFACFLIGSFVESATGFSVGIIGTPLLVRRLGVAPLYLLGFGLIS